MICMRCSWAESSDEMRAYHDQEWGVPVRDDQRLFEFLVLEGAQAGLSWATILGRREGYRAAFHDFSIDAVAAMTDDELEALRSDQRVVRNRLKIYGARKNALAAQAAIRTHGSLVKYLWSFVSDESSHERQSIEAVPATTEISDAMSKALKKDGFTFVGSTICYAFMQATGMVNDHVTTCFRYKEIQQ
ncbi:DNA-3-methyladenine glycosylase I [Candidatus Saccharibacteria bacterium]|nr:DNA-3-methyladenine glycosylase I [Candidatus Saccharibacteria bacterium]